MFGSTSIEQVYGRVGSGYSHSIFVLGRDGNEYYAKGPSLVRRFRHVATNEIIVAQLASRMGLLVPSYGILTQGKKKLFFGSVRFDTESCHPSVDEDLFNKSSNNDHAYEIAVLDALVCNLDRHEGNLLAKCSGQLSGGGKPGKACRWSDHLLFVIDHDGCLLSDDRETSSFDSHLINIRVSECVTLPFIRKAVISPVRLGRALCVAESIADAEISTVVNKVPPQFLPVSERPYWVSFLVKRRDLLRRLFNAERNYFYLLNKGVI
jgi:hypothetical protein